MMNISKLFATQKILRDRINYNEPDRTIPLSQGKVVIVDETDFEELSKQKWYFNGQYAVRNIRTTEGKRKTIFMHRVIMRTPEGMETDHINGNTLDNRKDNLRICTKSNNQWNINKGRGKSKYRGVSFYKTPRHKTGYWIARIMVNNKRVRLGYFKSEKEAAIAYNNAAVKYHGEYANLNEVV